MSTIDLWFPVAIYKVHNLFDLDTNMAWTNKILELEKTTEKGGKEWLGNTITTHDTFDLQDDKDFVELLDVITNHVHIFAKEHQSFDSYLCNHSWFNINYADTFQEFHTHDGSIFSAVYYVHAPINCGKLIFEDPKLPDMLPIKNIKEKNDLTFGRCGYMPSAGSLYIFRSYLRHCVEPGKNTDPRISISLNFS